MKSLRGMIIRLFGNKKRKEIDISKINRILIPSGRIGDIVCSTPFIREIHNLFPNAQLDIYLDKVTTPIMQECPYVNVITTERSSRFVHKVKPLRVLNAYYDAYLKRGKYDLYFDVTNNLRVYNIVGLRILKPRYALGHYRREAYGIKKDELTIYDKYVSKFKSEHIVDICLGFVEIFGKEVKNRRYEIFLGNKEKKYEDYFEKDKINIIFNYIGGTPNKLLPLEEMKESCYEITQIKENIIVHIMTLPKEYKNLEEEISKWGNPNIKICPLTEDVLDAAALIKYCDALVSVDTGVVHIASAFNVPVISIFPDNDNSIEYFSPKSDYSYVIKCRNKKFIRDFDKEELREDINDILDKINK